MLNKCNFCQISLNKLFLNRIKFHFKTCKIFIYRFQSWQYSIYMINLNHQKIVVVQSLSCVQLFCNPMNCRMPGFPSFTISQSSLKLMSIESVIPSHPLVPPSPPALNLSQHQGFFFFFSPNQLTLCIRWPKYWSFSISPSSEYSGLISFRID